MPTDSQKTRGPEGAAPLEIGRRGWLVAGAAVLVAVAAALWAPRLAELFGRLSGEPAPGPIRSLAVLPLDNLSGDPAQLYFVDGMHEELIANLARIDALKVISRTSTLRYREGDRSLPEIGRELGVDAVVEGSVLRAGDRVRINAQLVHAASDTHLWADSYEGDLSDILRLQGDTARAIAREIEIAVTAEDEARLDRGERVDRVAFEEFLKGRHQLNQRTRDEIFLSLEHFQRAIDADPAFHLAHAAWAEASILTGWYRWVAPEEAFPRAKAAAERALALAPNSAEAHTMAAAVFMLWDWDYVAAEKEYQRAIELNPGYPRAHHWYALFLSYMTRYDEAVARIRQARELDPLSTIIRTIEALCYCQGERYEEAIEAAWEALEMTPDFPLALGVLNCGYLGLGRFEEALAEAELAYEVTGGAGELADLIETSWLAGRRAEALELLAELEARAEGEHVSATVMAGSNLVVGRHERALDWLERAYDQRDTGLADVAISPLLVNLHDDPRWPPFLEKMGMAGVQPES